TRMLERPSSGELQLPGPEVIAPCSEILRSDIEPCQHCGDIGILLCESSSEIEVRDRFCPRILVPDRSDQRFRQVEVQSGCVVLDEPSKQQPPPHEGVHTSCGVA